MLTFPHVLDAIGYFEPSPTLAVAVSGGADSMALLLLAHEWAQARGGKAVALTVDHSLRKESAEEAKQVARWCRGYGIEHHILCWQPPATKSGIPAKAREARYRLMVGWCRENHVLHLLTAHHRDDQTETLFLRLSRQSRLEGLAAMPVVSTAYGLRLIRPLLGTPKSALEAFLNSRGQGWINDPSNDSPLYTRNRLRANLLELTNYADISARSQKVTHKIAKIRNHLENKTAIQLTNSIHLFPEGYGVIQTAAFGAMPEGLAVRALSSLIQTLGEHDTPPRLNEVERLYASMPWLKNRTFGRLIFQPQPAKKRILVKREHDAGHLEEPALAPHIQTSRTDYAHARFRPAKALAGEAFFSMNDVE